MRLSGKFSWKAMSESWAESSSSAVSGASLEEASRHSLARESCVFLRCRSLVSACAKLRRVSEACTYCCRATSCNHESDGCSLSSKSNSSPPFSLQCWTRQLCFCSLIYHENKNLEKPWKSREDFVSLSY